MFLDRSVLHDQLFGLVGFEQPSEPSLPNILPSLEESRSNMFYNGGHYLLSHENIYNSIKNFAAYHYDSYVAGTDAAGGYRKGSKVRYTDGKNYEYTGTGPSDGTPPPSANWTEIDEYNDFLNKVVTQGIDRMLDSYMYSKKMKGKVKSAFENVLLFNGAASKADTITNQNRYVGLRLRFKKREQHLVTILNKIGVQLNEAVPSLNIYLHHTSQIDPVAVYEVSTTTANSFKWTSLTSENLLRYVEEYDAGGDWFLGYRQSDLGTAQAIGKDLDWDSVPCDCDDVWMNYYKQYSRYVDILAFSISEDEVTGTEMFDVRKADYSTLDNWGLNLNLTTKCDLAPFFLQEEAVLAEAMKYNVGMVLMEALASNTRGTNQRANQVKVEAQKQLFHHTEAWGTIADRAKQANEGLSFDMSGMHNGCMPDDNPQRVRIRSRAV
jgi:hypothetical protein